MLLHFITCIHKQIVCRGICLQSENLQFSWNASNSCQLLPQNWIIERLLFFLGKEDGFDYPKLEECLTTPLLSVDLFTLGFRLNWDCTYPDVICPGDFFIYFGKGFDGILLPSLCQFSYYILQATFRLLWTSFSKLLTPKLLLLVSKVHPHFTVGSSE